MVYQSEGFGYNAIHSLIRFVHFALEIDEVCGKLQHTLKE